MRRLSLSGFLLVLLSVGSICSAESPCAYLSDTGEVVEVPSISAAPMKYRSRVVCGDTTEQSIPSVEDVDLGPAEKTASFVTDLGPIDVRWPLKIEKCFGRSPSRAVADAASTVNRALASANFPSEIKNRSKQWTLVFTDLKTAQKQFPAAITIGGHPGFMLPPNQIYLISDFISPNCSADGVGDEALAQVLLHEMGHVIEYLMLGQEFGLDRARAEGFASWFEQYSSDYSRVIPKNSVKNYYRALAAEAMKTMPTQFDGSPYDYARAALKFDAIVNKKGVNGLMDVYRELKKGGVTFTQAIEQGVRWNQGMVEREMGNLVRD